MESREQTETHREDREQGTPQDQLLGEERSGVADGDSEEPPGTPEEGGADSAADAEGKGG